jgi:hypothetical protein
MCEHVFNGAGVTIQGVKHTAEEFSIISKLDAVRLTFFDSANVPMFFLISGMLFFYNVEFDRDVYRDKLKRRVKTLLVPYITWNTVAILVALLPLIPSLTPFFPEVDTSRFDISFTNILSCYWNNHPGIYIKPHAPFPINGPLWYLRDLMIAVLCAPVIHRLIKRFGCPVIVLFGAIWFVSSTVNQEVFIYGRISRMAAAMFFFYWGAYLSINKVNVPEKFGKVFVPSLLLYLSTCALYLLARYCFPDYCRLIHRFTIICFIIPTYNIAVWILRHKVCRVYKFLAGSAFFIYVTHWLLLPVVEKVFLALLHPASNSVLFAALILTLVTTVVLLLGAYYVLIRFASPVQMFLTGRSYTGVLYRFSSFSA